MNILDINTLPTITLNVTGREGTPTSATVINQETKTLASFTNITYVQGETLEIVIDDSAFLSSIDDKTTLSVILLEGVKPLYRDVVRFSGELSSTDTFVEYDVDDNYFIYD